MSEFEHGLEEGDRLRSDRRESDLIVRDVRDTVVDFGGDVGERTHRDVASGLRSGLLERVDDDLTGPHGGTECMQCLNDISADVEGPFCSEECKRANSRPASYSGTAEGVPPNPELDETGGDR